MQKPFSVFDREQPKTAVVTASANPLDVVIIGAGIAGAAVARELSRYRLDVAVVEREAEVCFGATKGTHAIVHCGIPGTASPLKDRGELAGNRMMEEVCRELDVPFKRIGKLVVAFDEGEVADLQRLEADISRNGVPGVRLIRDRNVLRRLEPHLSDRVVAALHTPTTGITSPWSLVYGLMENAVANGCRLYLDAPVRSLTPTADGRVALLAGSHRMCARCVVNAAGAQAGLIASLAGDRSFTLEFLKMQRVILDRNFGEMATHLIRGLDQGDPLGDFVCPTIDGNLMLGSTVEEVDHEDENATTADGIGGWVLPAALRLVPGLPVQGVIRPFSAALPVAGSDYCVAPSPELPQLIHFVLGASGMTASVAMARYLIEQVLPGAGLELKEKARFVAQRRDMPHFRDLDDDARAALIARDGRFGRMVCRCESVSEGEISEAIRRGARTRDGIKFRTRAGMGRCQSNFCGPKLLEIMSRELGRPVETLTRRGVDSHELAVSGRPAKRVARWLKR